MLFLVCDRHGHPVGHLGFANAAADDRSMEIDNVVRGERARAPGLMGEALDALIAWAEELLPARADPPARLRRQRACDRLLPAPRLPRRARDRRCAATVDGDREVRSVPAADDTRRPPRSWPWTARPSAPAATSRSSPPGRRSRAREVAYALDAARTAGTPTGAATSTGSSRRSPTTSAPRTRSPTSSCTGALHLADARRRASARATR